MTDVVVPQKTLYSEIAWNTVPADKSQIPNRVSLLLLLNNDTTTAFAGWFLSGGNAAGLEEDFYAYLYEANAGWLFNAAVGVTHWAYPSGAAPTPPAAPVQQPVTMPPPGNTPF